MINIEKEFDNFFEFPTDDKSQVSSVSCRIFAKEMVKLAKYNCAKLCDDKAQNCSDKSDECVDPDDRTELRALAWQFSVLAETIRKSQ